MYFGPFAEYGLVGAMIGCILLSGVWVLRRLFARDGGIITEVGKRHIKFVDESASVMSANAETQTQLMQIELRQTELTTKIYEEVHELTRAHTDPKSVFATTALHAAGLGFCDIMAKFAISLDVDIESELRDIRRKLDTI